MIPRRDAEAQSLSENEIGTTLVAAAIHIHRELGPGLLETVYEVILARELSDRGLSVQRQVPVPIVFKGIRFDEGFRADMIIENKGSFGTEVDRANRAGTQETGTDLPAFDRTEIRIPPELW